MTDTIIETPIQDADGWNVHDGSERPIPANTLVDLRFHGYDAVRTAPYIRHHEMFDQEADTVRWTWIDQPYGRHHSDVSHWRLASWKEGRDEQGHLRADAHVAFRLCMGQDGRAPAGTLLAAWNALSPASVKHTLADLPADLTRIGNQIVCDTALIPIELTFREAVAEALRLSGEHRAPDHEGWHRMSNVARVMKMLVAGRDLRAIGATRSKVADALRSDPLLQTRSDGEDMLMRPADPGKALVATHTSVTCPGDVAPRELPEQSTFGEAFRALMAMGGDLVADGTVADFERGGETRQATWSQTRRAWITPDGRPLLRSGPNDPVLHHYHNGHMVDTKIGFVSVSRTGIHFANIGVPHDSEGDEDAYVALIERSKASDQAEAEALLAARDDLDHVLPGAHTYHGDMGFWLKGMGR